MQPILSPSKVSVHLSSWDISRDFHFHSNLLIYIAANNWQDYIKSFSIHGWRKILFSWPKRDIIFLLSSWDIAILFDRLHRFELGAIRFPRIFFNSNTWYWDENKAKLTNFIELAILEFWCPKRTHNTKSTKMPQEVKWPKSNALKWYLDFLSNLNLISNWLAPDVESWLVWEWLLKMLVQTCWHRCPC